MEMVRAGQDSPHGAQFATGTGEARAAGVPAKGQIPRGTGRGRKE